MTRTLLQRQKIKLYLGLLIAVLNISCAGKNDSNASSGNDSANENEDKSTAGSLVIPDHFHGDDPVSQRLVGILEKLYAVEFNHQIHSAHDLLVVPCIAATIDSNETQLTDDLIRLEAEACFHIAQKISGYTNRALEAPAGAELVLWDPSDRASQRLMESSKKFIKRAISKSKRRSSLEFYIKMLDIYHKVERNGITAESLVKSLASYFDYAREESLILGRSIFKIYYSEDQNVRTRFRSLLFPKVQKMFREHSDNLISFTSPFDALSRYSTLKHFGRDEIVRLEELKKLLLDKNQQPNYVASLVERFPYQRFEFKHAISEGFVELEIQAAIDSGNLDLSPAKNAHQWFVEHQEESKILFDTSVALLAIKSPHEAQHLANMLDKGITIHRVLLSILESTQNPFSLVLESIHFIQDFIKSIDSSSRGPESTELVLLQLKTIQENVQAVQKNMNSRFDRVDGALNKLYEVISDIKLNDRNQHKDTQQKLNLLARSLQSQTNKILDRINYGITLEFDAKEEACLGENSSLFSNGLSEDRADCLASFLIRATEYSRSFDVSDHKKIVSPWQQAASAFCWYTKVCSGVINPQEWVKGTRAYLHYTFKEGKRPESQSIQKLISVARQEEIQWEVLSSEGFNSATRSSHQELTQKIIETLEEKKQFWEKEHAFNGDVIAATHGHLQFNDSKLDPIIYLKNAGWGFTRELESFDVDFGYGLIGYTAHPNLIQEWGRIVRTNATNLYWISDDGREQFLGATHVRTRDYGSMGFNLEACQKLSSGEKEKCNLARVNLFLNKDFDPYDYRAATYDSFPTEYQAELSEKLVSRLASRKEALRDFLNSSEILLELRELLEEWLFQSRNLQFIISHRMSSLDTETFSPGLFTSEATLENMRLNDAATTIEAGLGSFVDSILNKDPRTQPSALYFHLYNLVAKIKISRPLALQETQTVMQWLQSEN